MPTVEELKQDLDKRGIAYPSDARKADLERLAAGGSSDPTPDADPAPSADVATGPQHPSSIVEEAPESEKPGPASLMSKETRPDEQDLPPGESALQAPPEA